MAGNARPGDAIKTDTILSWPLYSQEIAPIRDLCYPRYENN